MFNNIDQNLIELQEEYETGDKVTFARRCIADLDEVDYTIMRPYIDKLFRSVRRISQNQATTVTVRDRVFVQSNDGSNEEKWTDFNKVYLVWTGQLP